MERQAADSRNPRNPSLAALFLVCCKIGALSFGGGLSGWIYQEFVSRRPWIGEVEFRSYLAVGQMLPGANVVNLVICLGERLHGLLGAAAAVLGLLTVPFLSVIGLAAIYASIEDIEIVRSGMNGVTYAAIGLILALALRGIRGTALTAPGLAAMAAIFVSVGILQWSLVLTVLCVAPVSVLLAWRRMD